MARSPIYNFVLTMWKEHRITETQIRSYVPLGLTQEEADEILATPQNPTPGPFDVKDAE